MAKKQIKKETIEEQIETVEQTETVEINNVDNNKENIKNIIEDDNKIENWDFFHLNEKLKSIENVIAYYLATAKANEGVYSHNAGPIYQYSMKKIAQLEHKKVEILDIMEKKILS